MDPIILASLVVILRCSKLTHPSMEDRQVNKGKRTTDSELTFFHGVSSDSSMSGKIIGDLLSREKSASFHPSPPLHIRYRSPPNCPHFLDLYSPNPFVNMSSETPFTLRWGILGAGWISSCFVKDIILDPKTYGKPSRRSSY